MSTENFSTQSGGSFIKPEKETETRITNNNFYHGNKTKVQMFVKLKTDEIRHFTFNDKKNFEEYDITYSFLVQRFNVQTNTGTKEDKIIGRDYTRKRAGQKTSVMTLDFIVTNFIVLDIANGFSKDDIWRDEYSLASFNETMNMRNQFEEKYEYKGEYIPTSIDLIITTYKTPEIKEVIYIKNAVITSSSFEMNSDSFLTGSLKFVFNKPYFLKNV